MFEPEKIVMEAFGRWAMLRLCEVLVPALGDELGALAADQEVRARRVADRRARPVCHCVSCAPALARPGFCVLPSHIEN